MSELVGQGKPGGGSGATSLFMSMKSPLEMESKNLAPLLEYEETF